MQGPKEINQNQRRHGQQGENGDVQGGQGDQNNEENGDCNDTENQTTVSVPHSSHTNGDQLRDSKEEELIGCKCTQNNKATALTRIGSQVIHQVDRV